MSEVQALQDVLAGEHAAVWVYGVLGGQTSRSGNPGLYRDVSAAYRLHRARRDELVRTVREAGETPTPAALGYELPNEVRNPAEIRATARLTEERCAATYVDLVGRTTGRHRAWAIRALVDAATRELDFGGEPSSLPGLT